METGNPNDCAMQITDIKDIDNGEWECSVTGKGPNGDFQIGQGKVQVIVAVPPTTVALQMDGQPITGKKSFLRKISPKYFKNLINERFPKKVIEKKTGYNGMKTLVLVQIRMIRC